ncbi:energy-coupling factor transporter transmembrane protein EcfT [Agromyces protaetiae]|uniref:Energy-coupling factor transporter transmembrane protein EcfT n=1 Tax=Agromyces protaetiae TaxID=2509455 RepID=A0A4P6FD86_9MICO|nr:energy-coupling factor transporter transmembrane protein EcfT [Agromyces protaetiae]QAY73686.1 energy-coupling factor transporter transmembrane protein EcfT [Agromyces protaetiae]
MIGTYVTGRSIIHRMPAGWKLVLLAASVVVIVALRPWWATAIATAVALALFAVARVPTRTLAQQLVPVGWLLLLAVPLNVIFQGWEQAALIGFRIVACIALAALVTLTTPVTAMLDAMRAALRPFERWIDADRVGLVLAMTIRAVPLMTEIVREVLDARRARGVEHSLRAVAVPVVVRALRTAEGMGEALIARGADD